jgi:hypothetical protein
MNVLLIASEMREAKLIEHELAKRLPSLHLEAVCETRKGIERLTAAENIVAVLLDALPGDGDPLTVIRAVRTKNLPVAVIGLVLPADRDSGKELMDSGADEFILKGPGFSDSVAAALRRRCVPDDPGRSPGNPAPKVLYAASVAGFPGGLALPSEGDTAGATRVLIRIGADLQEKLRSAEASYQRMTGELEEEHRLPDRGGELPDPQSGGQPEPIDALRPEDARDDEGTEFRTGIPQNGAQKQEAEEERRRLLEELHELEIQVGRRTEELRRERELSEERRMAIRQKLAAVDDMRLRLEMAVLEEEQRHQQEVQQYASEMLRRENQKHELERRLEDAQAENARLQENLRQTEAQMAAQLEQHRLETKRWESAALSLQQLSLEHQQALAQLASSRLELQKYRDERTEWASARAELESQVRTLEEEWELSRHNQKIVSEEKENCLSELHSSKIELQNARSHIELMHDLVREAAAYCQLLVVKLKEFPDIYGQKP